MLFEELINQPQAAQIQRVCPIQGKIYHGDRRMKCGESIECVFFIGRCLDFIIRIQNPTHLRQQLNFVIDKQDLRFHVSMYLSFNSKITQKFALVCFDFMLCARI